VIVSVRVLFRELAGVLAGMDNDNVGVMVKAPMPVLTGAWKNGTGAASFPCMIAG